MQLQKRDQNIGQLKTEVIVIGSGPGGATVARELGRAGKKVLLLERGIDHRSRWYYGTYLGAIRYCDRGSLLFTEEGLNIIRPIMVGGATSMYCGCAALPPAWLKARYHVDIDQEVQSFMRELEIQPLPPAFRGAASTRIAEAANALGYDWQPQLKFMRTARSQSFQKNCGARCMLGCRCGAKWNAAEFVQDAMDAGVELRTRAHVKKIRREKDQVIGVEGELAGHQFFVEAETVVLAAGGIGSPRILQASGYADAGRGMTMDTTVMVYGFTKEQGIGHEPPMTWSWEDPDSGYMLSTLIDPWLLYPLIMSLKGLKYPLTWPRWKNILGVMIKLKDEISGGVFANGKISKPLTPNDRKRLKEAEEICHKILMKAGADPNSLTLTPLRGTHPSGTVRIGEMVDTDLQTDTRGLYVCDASVFPEALDRPTVLTILGLASRLAKHLVNSPLAESSVLASSA